MLTIDMQDGGSPKRGELIESNIGHRKERTWMVLSVHRVKRKELGVPRYQVRAVRWWQLEPEMRVALYRSAERNGGQRVIEFKRYKAKRKKQTFEEYIRRG